MTDLTTPDPASFLGSCSVIDCSSRSIADTASSLRSIDQVSTVRECFEFVRDEIRHSSDFELNPVTCVASDVLKHRTGYCYAKSHLLAALLRANGIPSGLCYQRLTIDGASAPYCLHGLNAVYLDAIGWYRMDARGNKPGVSAMFTPPLERLAFETRFPGERTFDEIHVEPLACVVDCLTRNSDWRQVSLNLPDVDEPD